MSRIEAVLLSILIVIFVSLLQLFIYLEEGFSLVFYITLILYTVITVVGIVILNRIK